MTTEEHEAVLREWRRLAREIDHAKAKAVIERPGIEERVLTAQFAVEFKEKLDRLGDLAAEIEIHRLQLDSRAAAAMEGINAVWQASRERWPDA